MTQAEIVNALLKGLGLKPTRYLFRWSPLLKNPFHFDLLEVMRCDSDGEVMTYKKAASPLGEHAAHKIKSPGRFSFWDLLLVQLRIIE